MGLMLSILVVCVGVIEALSCYEHFQYGVIDCAANVYEHARRRSSVFLKYTTRRLKLLTEDSVDEEPERTLVDPARDAEADGRLPERPTNSVGKLEKEDKIRIVKTLLEKPRRPQTVRSISMPELTYTERDVELTNIINKLVVEPIEEVNIEVEDAEVLTQEFDKLFEELEEAPGDAEETVGRGKSDVPPAEGRVAAPGVRDAAGRFENEAAARGRNFGLDRSVSVDFDKVKSAYSDLVSSYFAKTKNDSSENVRTKPKKEVKPVDTTFKSEPVELIDETFEEIFNDVCCDVDVTDVFDEIEKSVLEEEETEEPPPDVPDDVLLKAARQLAELIVKDCLNLKKVVMQVKSAPEDAFILETPAPCKKASSPDGNNTKESESELRTLKSLTNIVEVDEEHIKTRQETGSTAREEVVEEEIEKNVLTVSEGARQSGGEISKVAEKPFPDEGSRTDESDHLQDVEVRSEAAPGHFVEGELESISPVTVTTCEGDVEMDFKEVEAPLGGRPAADESTASAFGDTLEEEKRESSSAAATINQFHDKVLEDGQEGGNVREDLPPIQKKVEINSETGSEVFVEEEKIHETSPVVATSTHLQDELQSEILVGEETLRDAGERTTTDEGEAVPTTLKDFEEEDQISSNLRTIDQIEDNSGEITEKGENDKQETDGILQQEKENVQKREPQDEVDFQSETAAPAAFGDEERPQEITSPVADEDKSSGETAAVGNSPEQSPDGEGIRTEDPRDIVEEEIEKIIAGCVGEVGEESERETGRRKSEAETKDANEKEGKSQNASETAKNDPKKGINSEGNKTQDVDNKEEEEQQPAKAIESREEPFLKLQKKVEPSEENLEPEEGLNFEKAETNKAGEHSRNSENFPDSNKEVKPANVTPEAFWLIFSGEYTKAMSKDWHSGHFSCWQCDEALTGQRYVLRDDHPYCIKCYESVFANVCEECNKIIGIDSKDLSYKDKHWHEACFLCNKCRVSLVDKQFGSKADKIYCGNCYDAQFASRCDGCGEIFRAGTKKMEYKTRQWHEKCFCCCVCKTPIGTKSFIPREQEIYCATCYEEKFATRCVKCSKIITSGGVTYKNEPWHRECFTCTNCNTSLAGQRFTSRDEKPYCADCFGELFAKRCTACSRPITGIGGTRFISFEDRHWHNDCFICASCKTSLVGRGFITDGDDIICPECAKQKLM